jgi:hypothetical protein
VWNDDPRDELINAAHRVDTENPLAPIGCRTSLRRKVVSERMKLKANRRGHHSSRVGE